MELPFVKMHGAGNDFVVFDARRKAIRLTPAQLQSIADRREGIGCDQVIVLEPSGKADVFMRIYNADGSQVDACGNATRCVAWLAMEEGARDTAAVETNAGILACKRAGDRRVKVDMGEPKLDWQDIPLSEAQDTLHLPIEAGGVCDPLAVSMGNPHMVFVVQDVRAVPVGKLGPDLERHPLFPQRANVSFAQPLGDGKVRMRVWERGSGETRACGTAACAALVGLTRRGLLAGTAAIELPGGVLDITWDKASNHVWMTGPVATAFKGVTDV